MDLDQYRLLAERTSKYANKGYSDNRLLMATLGLAGESGEIVDIIKKVIFHGHNLDKNILDKEIGDTLWYIAELCSTLDLNLNLVAINNLEKLHSRYGDSFSSEKSINRSE